MGFDGIEEASVIDGMPDESQLSVIQIQPRLAIAQ